MAGIAMLKKLRIQNFKGWEDTGYIDMAPITLFFGANNSGKSSIGQFLMMLKQTIESQDNGIVFNFGDARSAVQLGSYRDIIFGHDLTRNIEFEYSWQNPWEKKDVDFYAKIGSDTHNNPRVEEVGYRNLRGKFTEICMRRADGQKYEIATKGGELRRRKAGRAWLSGPPIHFHAFPFSVHPRYKDIEFLFNLNLFQNELFSSLFYLGPIRTKPERIYTWAGGNPNGVGYHGENTVAAILSARRDKREINYAYRRGKKNFDLLINEQLRYMELLESIDVKEVSDDKDTEGVYSAIVQAKGSKHEVSLPDLGFGISQVLPVIVQCFYAPHNSIILIEQPELHLHPRAQMQLADVLISGINSREKNRDRNIQLIIETHSEHFLQRLQRRIAEKKVEKDKISAYFASNAGGSAALEKLQINQKGHIENWPEDFFGDEMGEIVARSEAAFKNQNDN